jgi:hypothetical protein
MSRWNEPLPEYGASYGAKAEGATERLMLLLTPRAKRCLQAMADSDDVSMGEYVRRLLDAHFATMPDYLEHAANTHVETLAAAVSAINAAVGRRSHR